MNKETEPVTSNDKEDVFAQEKYIDDQAKMEEKKPNTLMWGSRSFGSGLLLSKNDAVLLGRQIHYIEE